MSDYTSQQLETIKFHIEEFVHSPAHEFFRQVCGSQYVTLTRLALTSPLKGIETLFTREGILGEALNSDKFKDVFHELIEEIEETLKPKKK